MLPTRVRMRYIIETAMLHGELLDVGSDAANKSEVA
jgi:hypothetical protein